MSDKLKAWLPTIIASLLAVVLPALSESARTALINFVVANPEWVGVITAVATAIGNIFRSPFTPPPPPSS